MHTPKRLTLFAGHYGSGKTNIALNYARSLHRDQGLPVTIADLDIVNPYFRTKDSEQQLSAEGIGLICSPFANSNLDVPAMPKETYALIGSRTRDRSGLRPAVHRHRQQHEPRPANCGGGRSVQRPVCRSRQPSDRPAGLHDLLRRSAVSRARGDDRPAVPPEASETILSTYTGGVLWQD